MKKEEIKDVISDLNTYHEEKERKYFERNLLKQKLAKIIFVLIIILIILGFVFFTMFSQNEKAEATSYISTLVEGFLA